MSICGRVGTVVPSISQVNSNFSSQIPDLVRVDVEAPDGRVLRQRRNWPNLLHLAFSLS
jgi:hypothetical protein